MADGWFADDAPGECRRVLLEGGRIVELHLYREGALLAGETGNGRIREKGAGGTILLTDAGAEVLMRGACPAQGQSCAYVITREAIAEPGLTKRAEGRVVDALSTGRKPEPLLAAAPACGTLGSDIDDVLHLAQSGQSVAGSAVLTFERTKAGLVIDVDGIGDAGAINRDAAIEVARLLRLFQVGGMVMVDFIASDSKADRQAIGEAFDAAAFSDPRPFERTAVNGFGMMQIVRPRPRPSLLDQLFGTRRSGLSDETQSLWLLRDAARSSGFGERVLTARPAAARLIESSLATALDEAARQCGAAIRVIADPGVPGYGHVHVAQS